MIALAARICASALSLRTAGTPMRTTLLCALLLLLLPTVALLQGIESLPAGFRGAHWGDPLSAITISAPDQLGERTPDALSGRCQLAGRDFRFVYSAQEGKLARGAYLHDQRHVDSNTDVAIFDALKAELSEKYGAPKSDQELWSNALFKGERSKLGTALAIAAVVLRAQWDDGTNYIRLQAQGKDIDITVSVTYGQLKDLPAEAAASGTRSDGQKL